MRPITAVTGNHGRPITDHPNTTSPVPAPGRPWLTRLLAGELTLAPVAPAALPPADRTPAEADAAARALACPDLFLFDAPDRAARERVLADLLRAAAARGERVLALSPDPAAADRLAEAVAADHSPRVVRALAEDEAPPRSFPAGRLTSAAVGTGRAEQLRREAALAVSALEAKLSRLAAAAGRREQVRTLSTRLGEVERECSALAAKADAIEAEVRAEADGKPHPTAFTGVLDRLRIERETAAAAVVAERIEVGTLRTKAEAALADARQLLATGGKKSGLIARLLGRSKPPADTAELERQVQALEAEVKDLSDREAKSQAEVVAGGKWHAAERGKRIAEEIAGRRAGLEPRLLELREEKDRLDRTLRELVPPSDASTDTVRHGSPDDGRPAAEAELAAARDRLADLTRTGADLARRLLSEVRVVVGTPGCLEADSVFRAIEPASPPFGLLVLDHAEELIDPDFARLSRLAGRWVLAGDAAHPEDHPPHANGSHHRHPRPEPTFAARLARLLDREPWAVDGDRLVFRLAHLNPAQRWALSREPVLDHPHVELRMAAGDGGDPVLAEIAFPVNTAVAAAKGFLFSQLGEVFLRPLGELHWHHAPDRLTACWPAADAGPAEWVDLEPGVREKVAGAGPAAFTAAVAFDPAAGWDEAKAEAWLAARLPDPSAGRLAVLPRSAGHAVTPPRPVAV